MAEELEELQDDGTQHTAGSTSCRSAAPRRLEFRRGEWPDRTHHKSPRPEAPDRQSMTFS